MEYTPGATYIAPISILLLFILSILIIFGDRKYILIPFILASCFIPNTQRIIIGGLDFTIIRILVLVSWIRIILKREYSSIKLIKLDRIIISYMLISILAYTLQSKNISGFIYITGYELDTIGFYFIIRILAYKRESILISIRLLIFLSIPLAILFFYERTTRMNLFHYIGGVPLLSRVRAEEVRARGAFSHPIIAGAFWAVCIPLFLGFKTYIKHKKVVYISVISSLIIIYSCGSSTPVMSLTAGLGTLFLFIIRKNINRFIAAVIIILALIQLSMEKPIWFLFTKIDITGGSTGYFRYLLFDQFIRHTADWFFVGVMNTYYWGAGFQLGSVGLADLCIQYVYEGVRGGIGRLISFLLIIFYIFKYLSELIVTTEDKEQVFLYWSLTAAFIVHLFNFLGVSYFGQITLFWWYIISVIVNIYITEKNAIRADPANKIV